jgi:hypothetical protein
MVGASFSLCLVELGQKESVPGLIEPNPCLSPDDASKLVQLGVRFSDFRLIFFVPTPVGLAQK